MAWGDPITAFVIPIGVPTVLAQTTSYALPTRATHLQSTVVVETSVDGSTWTAVAASTTGVTLAAAFVRCTSATNAQLLCKLA